MSAACFGQYLLFLVIVVALVKPLGAYMARVFEGERTVGDPVLRPLERALYRAAGINPRADMTWNDYASSFIVFSLATSGWM